MCPAIPWSRSLPRPSGPARDVPRNRRQEETFRKVLAAGIDILRENVLRRPDGARGGRPRQSRPRDRLHLLLVEEPSDRRGLPGPGAAGPRTSPTSTNPCRPGCDKALRHLALVVADEPEVAAACTTALLGGGSDPAVRAVRDRIGAEIHRRITSAIGPDADPRTVSALEMTFFGALVNAASGALHLSPDRRPSGLRGRPHSRQRGKADDHSRPTSQLSSTRTTTTSTRIRIRTTSGCATRPRCITMRSLASGRCPGMPTCTRDSATAPRCPTASASRWTRRPAARTPPRRCRFWRWTIRRICGCARWCRKASRPGEFASSSRGSPRSRRSTWTPCWRRRTSGTVDYVDEFAGKLPMDVISELMGVPEPDRAQVRAWADGVMHRDDGVTDVPAAAIEASINLIVYYQEMVAERRKKPTDDLTTALLEAEIDGDRLTDDEIIGFMFLMVIAGNETTTKLLANAAFWGHRNPDQLTPVYADPSRVPLWVEETLRYDTSSQILARTVAGELDPLRHDDPRRRRPAAAARFRAPRRAGIRQSRRLRHRARHRFQALEFRQRRALLPGRPPGQDGGPGGAHRTVQANQRLPGRRGQLGSRPFQ